VAGIIRSGRSSAANYGVLELALAHVMDSTDPFCRPKEGGCGGKNLQTTVREPRSAALAIRSLALKDVGLSSTSASGLLGRLCFSRVSSPMAKYASCSERTACRKVCLLSPPLPV
jgi:hypothetical protein